MSSGPGLLVKKTLAQAITDSVITPIQWDAVEYSRIGQFSAATPSRLYVPAGARYAKVGCGLSMELFADLPGESVAQFRITKNGASFTGSPGNVSPFTNSVHPLGSVWSPWVRVVEGDYFEAAIVHTVGINHNTRTTDFVWMALELWDQS